jgi:hypothetical protein
MLPMATDDEKPDVLSSLPRTRPQRRSARRAAPQAAATAKQPMAPKQPAAAKKAPTRPKPRVAAKTKAKAVPPRIPPAGFAPPRDTQDRPAPSGVELVGTAIQAAGELAQMGAAIGTQALKSALGRLGR